MPELLKNESTPGTQFAWSFRQLDVSRSVASARRLYAGTANHFRMLNARPAAGVMRSGSIAAEHTVPLVPALPHNWPKRHDRHDWLVATELT
jgi:hypothetical protein